MVWSNRCFQILVLPCRSRSLDRAYPVSARDRSGAVAQIDRGRLHRPHVQPLLGDKGPRCDARAIPREARPRRHLPSLPGIFPDQMAPVVRVDKGGMGVTAPSRGQ